MNNHKLGRINEDVRREMTDILRSVKDPRVKDSFLTVVRVEVTNDLSLAKVYVSSVEGKENTESVVKGLKSAAGYVRSQLSSRLKLRKTPEIKFIADNSSEYSIGIDELLRKVQSDAENS